MTRCSVSVVIPCYRCSETIERAIDSVVRQTVQPEEIILVDDCSQDGTLQRLETLGDKYHKGWIKVLPLKENSGPASARNAGWDLACTDYIAFLDADDTWHPEKLAWQYDWMCANPAVALTGHGTRQLLDDDTDCAPIKQCKAAPISRGKLLLTNQLPTRSVMVRRELPFRFRPGKRYSEDYLLWLQIILRGYPVSRLEAVLSFSYKADFGDGGLTGNLWQMEKGEINTFRLLYQDKLISRLELTGFVLLSLAKYVRRLGKSWSRRVVHTKR